MHMPAVIGVSLYFEKKRPIAVGLGMCGTGVGTFVFGPLSQFLLEHMSWKGAHFVLGNSFHCSLSYSLGGNQVE